MFDINAAPKLINHLFIKNNVSVDIWGRKINAAQDMPAYVSLRLNSHPLHTDLMISPAHARELAAILIAQADFAETLEAAA